jgi:hypothetical protein
MRVHYLQHVPIEGFSYIDDWDRSQRNEVSATALFSKAKIIISCFPRAGTSAVPTSLLLIGAINSPLGLKKRR